MSQAGVGSNGRPTELGTVALGLMPVVKFVIDELSGVDVVETCFPWMADL